MGSSVVKEVIIALGVANHTALNCIYYFAFVGVVIAFHGFPQNYGKMTLFYGGLVGVFFYIGIMAANNPDIPRLLLV